MTEICIISDGKPGHLNQSRGLAEALQKQRPDLRIRVRSPLSWRELLRCWGGRSDEPPAALLIGAGRRTHLSLVALRRALQAPAVVLMRPSLPPGCFDLCLVPEHDDPPARDNVEPTRGALNRMVPGEKIRGRGLILLGGPSKHFDWGDDRILAQLRQLTQRDGRRWCLTTSRRTPPSLTASLASLAGVDFVPVEQTGPDWLVQQLAAAECCWVTADSVSMLFEALSAGCAVGVLELEAQPGSRVARGVQKAIEQRLVTPFSHWAGGELPLPPQQFNEAGRCARLIQERFEL